MSSFRQNHGTKNSENVFAYGSLMFEEVWQKVACGKYNKLEGTLYGYTRKAVRNEDYPAIVKSVSESSVKGIIYKDVAVEDIFRLDDFEGEYYLRETGQIITPGNHSLTATFYSLKPEFMHILAEQDWDLQAFQKVGIHKFLKRYMGFQNINF